MIEYYTLDLGLDLAMFTKDQVNPTLAETYEEAERVEAEKENIEDYPEQFGEKRSKRKPYCCLNLKRGNHMISRKC